MFMLKNGRYEDSLYDEQQDLTMPSPVSCLVIATFPRLTLAIDPVSPPALIEECQGQSAMKDNHWWLMRLYAQLEPLQWLESANCDD